MAPTKEKKEHVYTPPSFIDTKLIRTLSKEKKNYWANRIEGKPGQRKLFNPVVATHSSEVTTSLDNNGKIIVHNRKSRRARPLTLNIFTKATNSIKKERSRNEKQKRSRAVAEARKARRARYSQVS